LLFEDSFSHYYTHFLKGYLGEGIVSEHKVLIVDPEGSLRGRDYWPRFMPAVYKMSKDAAPLSSQALAAADNLKVAWRYQNLVDGGPAETTEDRYRFDNSREMGKAFANSMSNPLNKEEMTVVLQYFAGESGLI
jgi:hypothetical protein